MFFSQLPNELFRMVMEQVKEVGPDALLPLRATSRLLRDEVNDMIFVKSSVAELKAGPYMKFVEHNTDLYLFGKLLEPEGVQPELLALVHKMTDYLCSSLDLTAEDDRLCCERRLCEGLVQYYGGQTIRRLLWSESANSQVAKLAECYKELTAVLFGSPRVHDYLWRGSLNRIPTLNQVHATPLVYAVASEDTELLDQIIEYYKSDQWSIAAYRKVDHMKTAIELALKKSRADSAMKIVRTMNASFKVLHGHSLKLSRTEYLEWLNLAIPFADPECVQIITQLCPGGAPLRNDHFTLALKSGSFEMVKTLFEIGKIGVNAPLIDGLPIKIACGAGNIAVIQGLVDAGSQVPDTALSYALKHDKLDAFLYLWRLGYPVPTMDKWPRKCSQTMYECLCMMKIAEGAKRQSLPHYDNFKGMSAQALRNIAPPSAGYVAKWRKEKEGAAPWSWLDDMRSE
jgi:hypothetical protein